MNDSEIKDGKIIIKKPGFECSAIALSVLFWIIALAWWINVICK
jgi:hypothetical protein